MAKDKSGGIAETIKVTVYAILIALVVRTFAFEPFNIPSGSMIPTLLVGDYLFVSKYSYGYSRFSFPLGLPLFSGRIFGRDPERGDVVVFKLPRDNATDYIKRVVGLPGDRIQVRDGVLFINGEAVKRRQIEDYVPENGNGFAPPVRQYLETLPNGRSYRTLDMTDTGPLDNTGVYEVPAGHYFFMGDNRDNSLDSRVLGNVGYVPAQNLVGRAEFLFFSLHDASGWEFWKWPFALRYSRLFHSVEP
ncbi:MAG: signal peptidase I [Alphaproteobacteria bacterium]